MIEYKSGKNAPRARAGQTIYEPAFKHLVNYIWSANPSSKIASATVDDIVPAIVTFGMRLGKDVLVLSKPGSSFILVYPCQSMSMLVVGYNH